MIIYTESLEGVEPKMLTGFWQKWDKKPKTETTFRLLEQSQSKILAIDERSKKVIGFITALSDNVMSVYIPFVEVLPEYQGQRIGQKLIKKMFKKFKHLFMIDLICEKSLQTYYEKLGMIKAVGMSLRHYQHESGTKN